MMFTSADGEEPVPRTEPVPISDQTGHEEGVRFFIHDSPEPKGEIGANDTIFITGLNIGFEGSTFKIYVKDVQASSLNLPPESLVPDE